MVRAQADGWRVLADVGQALIERRAMLLSNIHDLRMRGLGGKAHQITALYERAEAYREIIEALNRLMMQEVE